MFRLKSVGRIVFVLVVGAMALVGNCRHGRCAGRLAVSRRGMRVGFDELRQRRPPHDRQRDLHALRQWHWIFLWYTR
jgi:hypothetical protein